MTKTDIESIVSEKQVWRCPPCTTNRKKSMNIAVAVEEGKADISLVILMLDQASENRKRMETQFNASF
jgi:hypothetical protein